MNCNKIEKLIKNYVNHERAKRRFPTLKSDFGLIRLSRRHSSKMASRGRIWHGNNVHIAKDNVQGKSFLDTLFQFFLPTTRVSGENVAMMVKGRVRDFRHPIKSDKDVAFALYQNWMRSSGHRSNILNPSFSRIGIGVARRGNRFYATQLFYG